MNNPTPGAGTSWATTFNNLTALNGILAAGDQVWVAAGTYFPGTTRTAYYFPNAFTPNGDGKNDEFRLKTGDSPKSFNLAIFNRYGARVFESLNPATGWNGMIGGTPAPQGTYVYTFQGTTSAGAVVKKQGTIVLIR